MLGPVLKGDLISLEPARKEYLQTFIDWFSNTDITRYLLRRTTMSIDQEGEWFERVSHDQNAVHWTIMLGGVPIGVTGLHAIDWINRRAVTGTAIGVKEYWGRGYASEVVRLRTTFAFDELNLESLETHSMAPNKGMHKALERSGYRQIAVRSRAYFREGQWQDAYLFELLRDDWRALRQGATGPA
jgi:ribosomal-protein-alanine N-acetyltransferase